MTLMTRHLIAAALITASTVTIAQSGHVSLRAGAAPIVRPFLVSPDGAAPIVRPNGVVTTDGATALAGAAPIVRPFLVSPDGAAPIVRPA